MDIKKRICELVDILNDASKKYYADDTQESPLTDVQYDNLLRELVYLEDSSGFQLPNSPTLRVGFEDEVEGKIKHFKPVLSLKDTKHVEELLYFLGEKEGVLSWKLDGVSIVLYYSNGKLARAISRGDGHHGKDISKNVIEIPNIPKTISLKSNIIVRGEGCLSLSEFEQIKNTQEGERFSNPRNLASGLINATRTTSILLRRMHFVAHSIIVLEDKNIKKYSEQLEYLNKIGFTVVPHSKVLNFELAQMIDKFTKQIKNFPYPVDGLVLKINDLDYGDSLGTTAKYPKNAIAFKWPDEVKTTKVTGMDWSVSKTGLITPIVIFEPVQLEGTVVKRANLHNLKFFENLDIGIGDTIKVYKANKIIPEVEENLTRSGTEKAPKYCPVCGERTKTHTNDKTKKLYCYRCGGK